MVDVESLKVEQTNLEQQYDEQERLVTAAVNGREKVRLSVIRCWNVTNGKPSKNRNRV